MLAGDAIAELDDRGVTVRDDTLLILLNADVAPVSFALPPSEVGHAWTCLFDTNGAPLAIRSNANGAEYPLGAQSLALLRLG
jgi:glycogen operon protein